MKQLFIINSHVIDPANDVDAKINVLIKDGKVAELTTAKKLSEDVEIIDAKDAIVSPGFIDLHCHLREPGQEYKEDIASGSAAAAAGGFTSICCMPNTNPVNDCAAVTDFILQRARQVGLVKVYPVGAISKGLKGESLADIGDLANFGVVGVSDDGRPVMNSSLMRRAMEYASSFNLPVISHAEDLSLAGHGVMNEGATSTELGLAGIPAAAEDAMIARDILLSSLTGAHLHIAHVSTAGGVEMVRQAKKLKLAVTCEATPHHFTLTEQAVHGYDPNTKVNPPLRSENDRNEVILGLADGTIDAIATDHAPHNIIEKELGFEDSAFGMIGLETALPLSLKLVHDKKITLKRMVEALTIKPAQIFNLKAGSIGKGDIADIVIFNPKIPVTIQSSEFKSKSRNTPFNGWHLLGKVLYTIVDGKIVFSQ
ncbi:MAG: dihydroorotase [Pseudomonadota bacterium]